MRSRGRAKSSVGGEQGKAEREREREREKTKLRERLRRSITSKIMEGLRKHGGYDLPVRADINDVLRALAAEAGWVVEPDGTTYRRAAAAQNLVPLVSTAVAGASSGRGGGNKGIGSSAVAAPPPADQGQSLFSLQSYEGCGAGAGGFPDLLLIGGGVAPVAEAWLPEAWAWGQGAQQNV